MGGMTTQRQRQTSFLPALGITFRAYVRSYGLGEASAVTTLGNR
jgi:hypothetical protein